jgi:AraC family transcriptional regulator
MTTTGRDRLRELLDAVLAEGNRTLDDMADGAAASPFHFSRELSRLAGEPPVTMKRRVLMERAAWQIARGTSVTDAAFDAGYESVEGFSRAFVRAFGHPPSATPPAPDDQGRRWLPAPNGVHFHPPTSLWLSSTEQPMNPLTDLFLRHDVDDTSALLDAAKALTDEEYRRELLPGTSVTSWEGPEPSVAAVLEHHVWTKEVWVAAIVGDDVPDRGGDDVASLVVRHEAASARWLAAVRDIDQRGAWADRMVDALCDPPETFVLAGVVAHVLTYAAHRRQLVRHLLRTLGREVDDGDPITWLQGEAEVSA